MWITNFRFAAPLILCLVVCPQLIGQCSGLSTGTEYKVLVDEVQYSASAGVTPAVSLDMLQASVEGALEKVRQRLVKSLRPGGESMGGFEYLPCTGRHPRETEFSDDFVRSMVGNHAILEFWGTLFALDGGQHKFDIRYVMFPVNSARQPRPSQFAATQKTVNNKPTPEQVTKFFVDALADLPTNFTVSAGLQKYADRQLPEAVRFLCEARTRLQNKPDQQDLSSYVDTIANKAGAELRQQTLASGASLLSDADAKDYCTFATTR